MSVENISVIHDIGYQRYTGPRLGRRYAARSLYVHGLRTAFGLGRSAKAKVFPWIVVGIVAVIAAVVTAVRSQSGEPVLSYVQFGDVVNFLIILFCAVVAPELVSRDLRTGVLPLYFSRPLTRTDYALAKLAALISAVWLLVAGPQLLMFIGAVFSVHGFSAEWNEGLDFLQGLAYAGVYAVVFASLSLFIASLASRRAVSAAVIVAVFLVTTPVYGVLSLSTSPAVRDLAGLASPLGIVYGIGQWLFPPGGKSPIGGYGPVYALTAAALVAASVLLLLARYRKVAQ
jgi:ABC-2 type transport system permease protein